MQTSKKQFFKIVGTYIISHVKGLTKDFKFD